MRNKSSKVNQADDNLINEISLDYDLGEETLERKPQQNDFRLKQTKVRVNNRTIIVEDDEELEEEKDDFTFKI